MLYLVKLVTTSIYRYNISKCLPVKYLDHSVCDTCVSILGTDLLKTFPVDTGHLSLAGCTSASTLHTWPPLLHLTPRVLYIEVLLLFWWISNMTYQLILTLARCVIRRASSSDSPNHEFIVTTIFVFVLHY